MKKKTQVKFKGKGYNTSAKLIEEYKELHGPGIYAFRTVCSPTISTTGQAYKLGMSESSVLGRVMKQKSQQTSGEIELIGAVIVDNPKRAFSLEQQMHRHFEDFRIHDGEFFAGPLSDEMILSYLSQQEGFLKREIKELLRRCRTKISTLDGVVPIAKFRPRCFWHPELTAQIMKKAGSKETYRKYSIEHLLEEEPRLIHHPSVVKTKRKGKIIYRAYASHRYHEDRMKQKRYEKQQQIVGTLETCMS
tara:strand:- start:686 stop:1429 length:744 start_codon:yes stop_codon:yes gene_type:complete